jgi:hypothetical protein
MKEGGVNVMLKKMREKKEREDEVLRCDLEGMNEFLHSSKSGKKRRRQEMKGMTEWREEMWEIEREGGCDSLFSFLSSSFGKENVKEIVGWIGVFTKRNDIPF